MKSRIPAVLIGMATAMVMTTEASPVPHWFDGFDVTANSNDINFEIGNPRQGGSPVPLAYVAAGLSGAEPWRTELTGPGGNPLQLAGSGAVHTLVSPNYDFSGTSGLDVIGKKVSVTIDTLTNPPAGEYYSLAAITVGSSAATVQHATPGAGFSVSFVEDGLNGGNGNFIQLWDGDIIVGNLIANPAGAGPANVELFFDDPNDGNPWDGSGSTDITVMVNGSIIGSYTKGSGGYTTNFITLEGSDQKVGAQRGNHTFDNLTVFKEALPAFYTNTDIYVSSSTGSDTNTGLSPDEAWATFTNINAAEFGQGATIHLKRGDSWLNAKLEITGKGAAGNPVTLTAYGEGPSPLITGINLTTEACIVWNNPSHARIDSMHCKDAKVGLYLRFAGGDLDGTGPMFNNQDVHVTACTFENMDELWSDEEGRITVEPPFELSWGAGIWLGGSIPSNPDGPWPSETALILDDFSVTHCGFKDVSTGVGNNFYFPPIYRSRFTNFRFEDSWVTGCENGAFALFFVDGGHAKRVDTWVGGNGFYRTGTTGAFIQHCKNFLVEDCQFAGNKRPATSNDGIGFDFEGNSENIFLRNSVIHENDGGAILVLNSAGDNRNLLIENITAWNNCRNPRQESRGQNKVLRYSDEFPYGYVYGQMTNVGVYLGTDEGIGPAAGTLAVYNDFGDWQRDFTPVDMRTSTPWSSVSGRPVKWEFTSSVEGWTDTNDITGFGHTAGAIIATSSGTDPYLTSPATWSNTRERRWVRVTMSSTAGTSGQIFFQKETDPTWSAGKSVAFTVIPDGLLRTYIVDMGQSAEYNGVITKWRLDPTTESGANLIIDEFCSEEAPYLKSVVAVDDRTLDLTFSQAMYHNGGVFTPANFTLSGGGSGDASAQPDAVSLIATPTGPVYRLTWNSGGMNGLEATISAANATDARGNPLWSGSTLAVTTQPGTEADADRDGMGDEWELANGLNPEDPDDALTDLDKDGSSNRDEFNSNTDPNNPASVLRINELAAPSGNPASFPVTWPSRTDVSYTVEVSTNLSNWSSITPEPLIGTGGDLQIPVPVSGDRTFVRIISTRFNPVLIP